MWDSVGVRGEAWGFIASAGMVNVAMVQACLVGGGEREQEGVVTHLEDALLVHHVLHLLERDDLPLAHALERVGRVGGRVQHELDPAEGANAQYGHHLEIRLGHDGLLCLLRLLVPLRDLVRGRVRVRLRVRVRVRCRVETWLGLGSG